MKEDRGSSQDKISNQQEAPQDRAPVELGKDGFSAQEFEDLVLLINSRFAGKAKLEEAITATLEDVGRTVGVSRTALFLFSEDGKTVKRVFQWAAEDERSLQEVFKGFSLEKAAWGLGKLARGKSSASKTFPVCPRKRVPKRSCWRNWVCIPCLPYL